jgi:hypothetical protein
LSHVSPTSINSQFFLFPETGVVQPLLDMYIYEYMIYHMDKEEHDNSKHFIH